MIDKFNKPKIIGIVGDGSTGKSNLVYYLIEILRSEFKFNLYTYGLRSEIENSKEIYSINELEVIKNSIIFLDEFFTLFDLEDRKKRRQIENTIRLIHHNNNILVLVGLPDNFKKFISSKLDVVFYKHVTFSEFINGSSVKRIILDYKGLERGSSILNLTENETLVYDLNYKSYKIPYMKKYDTKKENKPLLIKKVPKIVRKKINKRSQKKEKK